MIEIELIQIQNLLSGPFPVLCFQTTAYFVLVLDMRKQRIGNNLSFMLLKLVIRISSKRAETQQTKPKQMKHHNVYENCISSNRKNLANDMRIYYTVEL